MKAATKQRALRAAGDLARRIPSDRAQMFAFVSSPSVRADPWPIYQRLHRNGPVRPGPQGVWIVASHSGVSTVLRRGNTSVDETRAEGIGNNPRGGAFTELMTSTLLFTDPPDHNRLRRLVTRDFTPARIADLEPAVRRRAQQHLDAIRGAGHADLLTDFALPFPVAVISDLLGLPQDDHQQFQRWAADLAPRLDVDLFRNETVERRGDQAAQDLTAYLHQLIDDPTRRQPGLLADLVDDRTDEDRLDNHEIVALCALLLVAGFETTANLIANSIHQLIQNPEEMCAIARGGASIDLAVEELLRTAGPVQFTQRVLLEDVDIDGHRIPAGTLVALLIGAANRDPQVFDDPDRIDLSRDPNPHLSFSFGIHHCLGAALARLEAAVAIPAIIQGLPNLALAEEPAWRDTFVLRGMTSLPVRWDL